MQRERLTLQRIANFTCSADRSQAFLWDTEAPRLAVRATKAGAKSFIFESKLNRHTVRTTIGDVRAWLLDDARAEARRLQTLVDQGTDPREVRREKAEAQAAAKAARAAQARESERRQRFTLRALLTAYADHLKAQGKVKTARDVMSAFRVHVFEAWPDVADLPAGNVTAHQVAAMVRKAREAGKERTAGILRNYVVAAYNAAKRAPFDSAMSSALIEFEITQNPGEPVPALPVNRGARVLSADELRQYLQGLGDDEAGCALRVAIYAGGQRLAQLLRAEISDFDTSTSTLRLFDGKGKRKAPREHLLPLGPVAANLVKAAISSRSGTDTAIFKTGMRAAGDRVSEIAKAMKEPFGLRDVRRTVETMLASMRISKDVRAQLLSHGIHGVQAAHYDRHDYLDEKRAALIAWEKRLQAIESGDLSGGKVVAMRKSKSSVA